MKVNEHDEILKKQGIDTPIKFIEHMAKYAYNPKLLRSFVLAPAFNDGVITPALKAWVRGIVGRSSGTNQTDNRLLRKLTRMFPTLGLKEVPKLCRSCKGTGHVLWSSGQNKNHAQCWTCKGRKTLDGWETTEELDEELED